MDRRLFYLHDKPGLLLMAGTFVGDCKPVVPETTATAFNKAWKKRHCGPPDADVTARDFPGLKYVRAAEGETETVTIGERQSPCQLGEEAR